MAKFMNAELIAIRDNLCCGHCGSIFVGSDSQAWKVKYEKRIVYCSDTCRHAAIRNKLSTPIPNRGPCLTCKKEFFSRRAKLYCCMDCYIQSGQFKEMLETARKKSLSPESIEKRAALKRTGGMIKCLECGVDIYQKRSQTRKFCNTSCYRSYMAKRFDRWVANPEGMSLPQCYDEFLDKELLSCFIEGCGWAGKHLTLHMNQAHGMPRRDFKRAAGFNLGTGVIAKPLAEAMRNRPLRGIAVDSNASEKLPIESLHETSRYVRYVSLEGKEHYKKARALAGSGPVRTCIGCSTEFVQKTPWGRTLYCSAECRDSAYSEIRRKNSTLRVRDSAGRFISKDVHSM